MEGIPPQILARLIAPTPDHTTTVLMTCGISGSGKSTLAKSICNLKGTLCPSPFVPFAPATDVNFGLTEGGNENYRDDPWGKPILADRDIDSPHHTVSTLTNGERVLLRLSREREYVRLSIDRYIWDHHGRYGIDYPPEKYSEYQSEASEELDKLFVQLLKRNKAQTSDEVVQAQPPLTIVLDYSFSTKTDRDDVKEIIEREGGRWVLVYFAISENRQAIRERVMGRRSKRDVESGSCDGDNAFEVTDEVLDTYFATFQVPRGEGEIVIH